MFPFKVYNYDEFPQSVVAQLTNKPLSADAVQIAAYDISPDYYLLLIPNNELPCTTVSSISGLSKVPVQGTIDNNDATPVIHPFSNPISTEKQNCNDYHLGTMSKSGANPDGHKVLKDNAIENTVNFGPVEVPIHCKMTKYLKNSDVNFDSTNEPDVDCHSEKDMMENPSNCNVVNEKADSVDSKTKSVMNRNYSKENSVNYGYPLNIVKRNPVVSCSSMSTKKRNPYVKINHVNTTGRNPICSEKKNIANLTSDVGFGAVNPTNVESDFNFEPINKPDTTPDVNCLSKNEVTENTANCDPVNALLSAIKTNSNDSTTKPHLNWEGLWENSNINYGHPANIVKRNSVVSCGSIGIKRRNPFAKFNRENITEKHLIYSEKINISNLTTEFGFGAVNSTKGESDVNCRLVNTVVKIPVNNCDLINFRKVSNGINFVAMDTIETNLEVNEHPLSNAEEIHHFHGNPVDTTEEFEAHCDSKNTADMDLVDDIDLMSCSSEDKLWDTKNSANDVVDGNHSVDWDSKNTVNLNPIDNSDQVNTEEKNYCDPESNRYTNSTKGNPMCIAEDRHRVCFESKNIADENPIDNSELANIKRGNSCDLKTNTDVNTTGNPMSISEDTHNVNCDPNNTTKRHPTDVISFDGDKLCQTENSENRSAIKNDSSHIAEDCHRVDCDVKNNENWNPLDYIDQTNSTHEDSCDPIHNTDMNPTVNSNSMVIPEDTPNINCYNQNSADRNPTNNIDILSPAKLCDIDNLANGNANTDSTHIAIDNHRVDCDFKNTADKNPIDDNDLINTGQENSYDSKNNTNKNPTINNSMPIPRDAHFVNCSPQNTVDRNPIDNTDQLNIPQNSSCDAMNGNLTVNSNPRYFVKWDSKGICDHNYSADKNPVDDSDLINSVEGNPCDPKNSAGKNPRKSNPKHIAEHNYNANCDSNCTAYKNSTHNNDHIYTTEKMPCENKNAFDMNPYENNNALKIGRNNKVNPCDPNNSAKKNPSKSNPKHIAEHNYNVNWDSNNTAYKNPTHNNDQIYIPEKMPCENKNAADLNPNENNNSSKIGRNNEVICDDQKSSIEISIVSRDLMSMEEVNPYDTMSTDNWNSIVNIISKNTVEKNPNNHNSRNVADKNTFINGKQINSAEEDLNVNCDPQDHADKMSIINSKPINIVEESPNNCGPSAGTHSFINSRPMNSAVKNPNISCHPHNVAGMYFIKGKPVNTTEKNPTISCYPQYAANAYSFINGKRINTAKEDPDNNCDSQNDADKNSFINCKQMNTAEDNSKNNCDPQSTVGKNTFINCKPRNTAKNIKLNTAEDNPNINSQTLAHKNCFVNSKPIYTADNNPNIICDSQNAIDRNCFIVSKPMNTAERIPKKCDSQKVADKNSFINGKTVNAAAAENHNINCVPQNAAGKNSFINGKPMKAAAENHNINCDPQNAAGKNSFINGKPMKAVAENHNINCNPQNAADKNAYTNKNIIYVAEENLNNNCDLQNAADRNLIVNNHPRSTVKDNLKIYCDPQNTTDRILINSYPMKTVEENAVLQNTNRNIIIPSKYSTNSSKEHFNVNCTTRNNTNINYEAHLNSSNSVALSQNNKCISLNNTQNNPDQCNPTNSIGSREGGSGFCFLEENTSKVKTLDCKISGEDLDFINPEEQGHSLSPNIPTRVIETECAFNPLNQGVNVLPMATADSALKEKYESMLGMKPSSSVDNASRPGGKNKHSLRFEPNLENLKLLKKKIENLKSGNFPRSTLISESPIATVDLLNTVKSKPNFNAKCENLSILKERYVLLASKGKDISRNAGYEMDKNKTESFKTKIAQLKSIVCSRHTSIYEKGIPITNRSTIQPERSNETKIKELSILKEHFESQLTTKSQLNYKAGIANNIQGDKYLNMSPQLMQNLKAQKKQQIYAKLMSTFHAHKNKMEQSLNKQEHPSSSYSEEKHRKLVMMKTMAEQQKNSVLKRNILIGASSCIQKDPEQILNPGMASTSRPLQLPSMPSFVFYKQCKEKGSEKEPNSQSGSPAKIFILNKPVPTCFQKSKHDSVPHNQKSEINNAISKPEEFNIFQNNSRLLSVCPQLTASMRPEINLNQILHCNRSQANLPSGQLAYSPLNALNMQSQENNSEKETTSHLDLNRMIFILNKPVPASCNLNKKPKIVSILHNQNPRISSAATNAGKDQFKNSSEMHSSLLNSKDSTHSKINLNASLNCNNASINKPPEQLPIIPLYTFNQQFRKTYVEKESNLEDSCMKILNNPVSPPNNKNKKSDHGQLNQKLGIRNIVPNPGESENFKNCSLFLYSKTPAELNIEKNQSFNSDCSSTFKFSEQSPSTPLNALNLQPLQKSSENATISHASVVIHNKSAPLNQSLTERSKFISVLHDQESRLGCGTSKIDTNNKCHTSSSQSWERYSKSSPHSYLKRNEKLNYNNASAMKYSHSEIEQKEKSNCNNASFSKSSHSEIELNKNMNCNNASATKFSHSEIEQKEKSNCNNASISKSSHSEIEMNKNVNCNNASAKKSHSDIVLKKKSNCNYSSKTSSLSEIKLNEKLNCSNYLEQRLQLSSNAFNPLCTNECLGNKSLSDSDPHIPILNYKIYATPSKHILKKKFRLVTNERKQNNEITENISKRKTFKFPKPFKVKIIDKGATLQNKVIQNFSNFNSDCEKDLKMQHLRNGIVVASPDATQPFCKEVVFKNELHNLKSSRESFVSKLENNKIIVEHSSPKPLRKSAVNLHNSTQISPNYFYKRKNIENSPKMKHLVVQLRRLPPEVINYFSSAKNAEAGRSSNDKELPMVLQKQPEYICDMASNKDCRKLPCKRKLNMHEVTSQPEKIQRIEKCSEDGVGTDCSSLLTDVNNSVACVDMHCSTFSTDENISARLDFSNEAFSSNPNLPLTSDCEYISDLNSNEEGGKKQCKRKINMPEVTNLVENKETIDKSVECIEDGIADVGTDCSSISTHATLSAEEESPMEPFLLNPTSDSKPLKNHINKISNFEQIENSENYVIAKEFSSATSQKRPAFISEHISCNSTFDSWSTREKIKDLRHRITLYKSALKVVSESRKSIWRIAATRKELRVRLFKLPYLPNKIEVPLSKLPDLIYEMHKKGKPIMLSNVMPLLQTNFDKNAPQVSSRSSEISPQIAAPHIDSTARQFQLPTKLKVDLFKLPDYIYEKHMKGKPIMLSNILPTISKVESVSVNESVQISNTVVKIERLDDKSL